MKFLIVFALCVAAATARFVVPDVAAQEAAEIQQILDMINHPNTDPATGAALQQLLDEILGVKPNEDLEEIAVGPVIVDNENEYEPISVGPAIVDPVAPSSASPLVQITINVNSGSANAVNVDGLPAVDRPTPVESDVFPTPVIVGPGFETFPVDDVHPSPVVVGPGFETFPVEDIHPSPVVVGPGFETFPVDDVHPSPVVVGPGFETFPVDGIHPSPVVVGPGFETFPVEDVRPEPVVVGPGFETVAAEPGMVLPSILN